MSLNPDYFPKVVRAESEAEKLRKKVKSLEDHLGVERAEGDIVAVETQDVAEAIPTTLDFPPEQPTKVGIMSYSQRYHN